MDLIPKKIHYCWLSNEKMAANYKKCIDSWKRVMPDYELILWDGNKFDIDSVPFVKEAVSEKKWAFAADYIRLYALFTEGEIYLDSDVLVLKRFDEFLKHEFFTSLEIEREGVGCELQAAILGAVSGHPFLKDCMDWYSRNSLLLPDGRIRDLDKIKCPAILASIAQKYGFEYKHGEQKLRQGMMIYDTKIFANTIKCATKGVYAIHWGEAGWWDELRSIIEHDKVYLLFQHYRNSVENGLSILQNYGVITKVMDVHNTPLYYFEKTAR